MNNKLSIKSIVLKSLQESTEPLFYLAPDVVGSINNAYPSKNKKLVVIDFSTTYDKNMKLVVPHSCYSKFSHSDVHDGSDIAKKFLLDFLHGARPYKDGDGQLDEIVDEFGEIIGSGEDMPANIRSNPGQGQTKHSGTAKKQYAAQYTRMISPIGYGGVVW